MSSVEVARAQVTATVAATSAVEIARARATSAGASTVEIVQARLTASNVLTANAGLPQSVHGLERVILDGSASTGIILQWEWTQDSGPAVVIDNPDSMYASFTAPAIIRTGAVVRVALRVRDAAGWSSPVYSTITVARHRTFRSLLAGGFTAYRSQRTPVAVGNQRPRAVIGSDQDAAVGDLVTLGGVDFDDDGRVIAWDFRQESGPVKLRLDGTGASRTLVPTAPGTYVFSKSVVDDKGALSFAAYMTLTVRQADFVIGVTKPTAENTGVLPDSTLVVHPGDLVIKKAGVYENLDVHGFVTIDPPPGTTAIFRNSIARGRDTGDDGINRALVFVPAAGQTGVLIENVEAFYGPAVGQPDEAALRVVGAYDVDGIKMASGTARRNHVHDVSDTAVLYGDGVVFEGNRLRRNIHFVNDPNWNGGGSHDDGIQIQGGDGHKVRGNDVEGGFNGGILVTQDVAVVSNLLLEKNWAGGGGASLNISEKGRGPLPNLRVLDNRFYRTSRLVGFPMLIAAGTLNAATTTIAGNVYDDDGTSAPARNGG